jgi:hypothetical protein
MILDLGLAALLLFIVVNVSIHTNTLLEEVWLNTVYRWLPLAAAILLVMRHATFLQGVAL